MTINSIDDLVGREATRRALHQDRRSPSLRRRCGVAGVVVVASLVSSAGAAHAAPPAPSGSGRVLEQTPNPAATGDTQPPSARPSSAFARRPKNDWLFRSLKLWGVIAGNVAGVSVARSETQTNVGPKRDAWSAGVASSVDIVGASRGEGVSVRAHGRAGLGGGQGGFDGRYELLLTGGPVYGSSLVGFAPRLGLGGYVRGNDRFYRASLALPRADLAFDLQPTEGLFFEVGATGAPTLVGRSNVDDTVRRTGAAWQAGLFGVVGVGWLSVVAQATREFARSAPGTPVDTLDVHACLNPVSVLVICPSALVSRGEALVTGGAVETRVRVFSLTLGYGAVEAM